MLMLLKARHGPRRNFEISEFKIRARILDLLFTPSHQGMAHYLRLDTGGVTFNLNPIPTAFIPFNDHSPRSFSGITR
jgi:hypothetical protein